MRRSNGWARALGLIAALLWWGRGCPSAAFAAQAVGAPPAVDTEREPRESPATLAEKPDQLEAPAVHTTGTSDAGSEHHTHRLDVWWQHGLNYRLREIVRLPRQAEPVERLHGRFGAQVQVDAAGFGQGGDVHGSNPGVELRRLYLTTTGDFFLLVPIDYKVQMGFQDKFDINEFSVRLRHLPRVPTLTIGQFKTPISLNQLTSSYETTFMERAAPVQAFVPGRKLGFQLGNPALDERMTWAVGWFTAGQHEATTAATTEVADLAARVTWCEAESDRTEPRHLFHAGLSGNWVLTQGSNVQYKARPESYLAATLVDTGKINATHAVNFGIESAAVLGPLVLQTEYLNALVRSHQVGTRHLSGLYFSGNVFLTGETRPYDRRKGVFGRVIPRRDFSFRERHLGALEWGVRYSFLDLDDGPISGGRMHVLTSGSSWYFNEYLRWQFEYSYASVSGGHANGHVHTVQTRMQLAF